MACQHCNSLTVQWEGVHLKAVPEEIKELLPYFVDRITFKPDEIKIALFDQPAEKGLFVNHSSTGALELIEWLPGHPQNPNFLYEVILGLTNSKSADRWVILN